MGIVNSGDLFPTNQSLTTLADVLNMLPNLLANVETLRAFGLGVNTVYNTVLNVIANITLNATNQTKQVLAVTSAASPGAITINLPLPQDCPRGSEFLFYDASGNCNTYNITIDLNGNEVDGSSSDLVMTANYGKVCLICIETGSISNPAKFVRTI